MKFFTQTVIACLHAANFVVVCTDFRFRLTHSNGSKIVISHLPTSVLLCFGARVFDIKFYFNTLLLYSRTALTAVVIHSRFLIDPLFSPSIYFLLNGFIFT